MYYPWPTCIVLSTLKQTFVEPQKARTYNLDDKSALSSCIDDGYRWFFPPQCPISRQQPVRVCPLSHIIIMTHMGVTRLRFSKTRMSVLCSGRSPLCVPPVRAIDFCRFLLRFSIRNSFFFFFKFL